MTMRTTDYIYCLVLKAGTNPRIASGWHAISIEQPCMYTNFEYDAKFPLLVCDLHHKLRKKYNTGIGVIMLMVHSQVVYGW